MLYLLRCMHKLEDNKVLKDLIQTTWGGANAGAGAAHDDNVVDADFEVKDDK